MCLGSYSQFVFADRPADLAEGRQRLAFEVRCLTVPPGKGVRPPTRYRAGRSIEGGKRALAAFQLAIKRLARTYAFESGSDSYRPLGRTRPYREGSASGIVGLVRVM